jgi:hypothetical protein
MTQSTAYKFVTNWTFASPVEPIWAMLMAPEAWPSWWKGVEKVELLRPGDANLIGAIRSYTFRSRLPYALKFKMETTRIEPMREIEGHATGELEGRGLWALEQDAGQTHVRYDWQVDAHKWWMCALAPIARPIFIWNHDIIMEWGRRGMAKQLGLDS